MADQKKSELETQFDAVKAKVENQVKGNMFARGILPLVQEIFGFMHKLVKKVDALEARSQNSNQ